ncbi:MAG: HisA/HisF-related TIM barrel protein [Candidatus Marinimicrobia bacterium]|nr:HisA/HisF-related TIM barrel protein [Candidatus Neomarinimicrobiota bacterium]
MRKRIIPCIFLKEGMIIRSEAFTIHQIIGNPINEVKRFSDWAVDEIIYIDISKDHQYQSRRSDHKVKIENNKIELLREVSRNIFVPLSFGGGVRTIEDIGEILQNGADKVILNTVLYQDDHILPLAVEIYGSQALVACVDYQDDYTYYEHGRTRSQYRVTEWCQHLEQAGIGEILLNDISRDGTGSGYDIKTIVEIVNLVQVPVIALGGAGDYYDFNECLREANPSAVAAGNIFHFKEHSYYHVKKTLEQENFDIRKEYGVF